MAGGLIIQLLIATLLFAFVLTLACKDDTDDAGQVAEAEHVSTGFAVPDGLIMPSPIKPSGTPEGCEYIIVRDDFLGDINREREHSDASATADEMPSAVTEPPSEITCGADCDYVPPPNVTCVR